MNWLIVIWPSQTSPNTDFGPAFKQVVTLALHVDSFGKSEEICLFNLWIRLKIDFALVVLVCELVDCHLAVPDKIDFASIGLVNMDECAAGANCMEPNLSIVDERLVGNTGICNYCVLEVHSACLVGESGKCIQCYSQLAEEEEDSDADEPTIRRKNKRKKQQVLSSSDDDMNKKPAANNRTALAADSPANCIRSAISRRTGVAASKVSTSVSKKRKKADGTSKPRSNEGEWLTNKSKKRKTHSTQKSKQVTATTSASANTNEEGEAGDEVLNRDHDLEGFIVKKKGPHASEKQSSLAALRSHFITFTERATSIKTGRKTTHTSSHCKYCQINFEKLLERTPEAIQKKPNWMDHYQPCTIANYRRNLILHVKRCEHFKKAVPYNESKVLIDRNMQALGMETSPTISTLTENTTTNKICVKGKGQSVGSLTTQGPMDKHVYPPINKTQQELIQTRALEFFVDCAIPFNVIEQPAFTPFVKLCIRWQWEQCRAEQNLVQHY